MKKLINSADSVVADALAGIAAAHPSLSVDAEDKVIARAGGNYITSLEIRGSGVTVCALTPELARLWDAPVDTPALRWGR